MTAEPPVIETERHERIAVLRFNRPGQLNAMSRLMMAAITDAMGALDADPDIDGVVLTGAGSAFMAGADIKEYAAFTPPEFRAFQLAGRRMYDAVERCAKPVVAAVNGYALGGGFEMALACDMVVAAPGALMGLPEVKLGLVPGGGGTQRLVRRIGPTRAFELLSTGRQVDAEEGRSLGLVNRVVEGDVVGEAIGLAREANRISPAAAAALKRLVRIAREADFQTGLDAEIAELERLYTGEIGSRRIREFAARSERRI